MGHSESLHKFIVFLLQTSCSPSPPEPGQQIKEKVAGAAERGPQGGTRGASDLEGQSGSGLLCGQSEATWVWG